MTPSRPTIYFIRHGETDWNLEGRLQGQKDIPLNDVGRVQAEEAARKLKTLVPHYEDLAYVASPMTRTRETMEILRKTLGLYPEGYKLDERLVELTFGSWEGMTWREDTAVSGVEPFPDVRKRVAEAANRALGTASHVLIVAHGGVARAFLSISCGVNARQAASMDIWQGRVLVIEGRSYRWV